ncbi:phosphonate C-P lyase system protein PhnH [Phreatobacter sp.]|uniref:phosphonate C-P lyase system protein PhnH n=1 Tax=Phreatobacter sp. TaxID=1966341 RepID=UPI0022CCBF1F|nr:phosphonate C-P lyase system protein PhnH [Phreatobacter sp.]MCZ8317043.1 phosphonate C-P lyase system protein PhnH [Phreatobacter sp.]
MAVALAFADPVRDAQAAFRAVMNAMARPGSVQPVAGLTGAPAPLSPTAAAIAVALADYETPLWLDPALAAAPDVGAWLTFHTGARIVAEPARAAFALVAEPAALPDFATFAQGTDVYPDRSTTLILQVASLTGGPVLRLSGPGISGHAHLAATSLPADITAHLAANHALFPRGVDLVLAGPEGVAALPRTTRVTEEA